MSSLPEAVKSNTTYAESKMSFRLPRSKYTFKAVPGYFVYTNSSVDNTSLPAVAKNFGLEPQVKWGQIIGDLQKLNSRSADTKEHYKLLYVARHGEGWHNVAEAKYGTEAWDDHWSLLNTDGELHWGPDPALTPLGEDQARDACLKWKELIQSDDPPPLPTRLFSSPFVRSAHTLQLTYEDILWPQESAQKKGSNNDRPLILESLRENFSDRHTCDERSPRSIVQQRWAPLEWAIDPSMPERDELFASELKESPRDMSTRLEDALGFIWEASDGHDVINITSHSGVMQALFRAVDHDDFKPKTGGMVPILIKASER